jgi:predicted nucleic acid-binding Zn ribbon protein
MENTNKCAHPICTCSVSGNEKYCSDHCRDAVDQDIVEISCDCGHTNCE